MSDGPDNMTLETQVPVNDVGDDTDDSCVVDFAEKFASARLEKDAMKDKDGRFLPNLANVVTVLSSFPQINAALAYDSFACRVVMLKTTPAHFGQPVETLPREWRDLDDKLLQIWLQENQDFQWKGDGLGTAVVADAVQVIGSRNAFHPVREYLDSLHWDGTPRIDNWLTVYCGADRTTYTQAVGAKWLISAVARVFEPGCQADHLIVFRGLQGAKKSTALRVLGGEWFTDHMPDLRSKDSSIQLMGNWIIEVSELDAMNRAEIGTVKEFITRRVDEIRTPYGRRSQKFPRQCVFAGTTNHETFLKDETGGRRFWPIQCHGKLLVDSLEKERDQLWAEAVDRYRAGNPWWMETQELEKAATAEQDACYESDEWEAQIARFIEDRSNGVSIGDVLGDCFNMPKADWEQRDQNRVGRCLKHLGWEKVRVRRLGTLHWIYMPKQGTT